MAQEMDIAVPFQVAPPGSAGGLGLGGGRGLLSVLSPGGNRLPRPVQSCVEVLNDRPATTMVLGILAKLLVPIVSVILAVTGIGLLVLPFAWLGVLIGVIVGKGGIVGMGWVAGRAADGRRCVAEAPGRLRAGRRHPDAVLHGMGGRLAGLHLVQYMGLGCRGHCGCWTAFAEEECRPGRPRRRRSCCAGHGSRRSCPHDLDR